MVMWKSEYESPASSRAVSRECVVVGYRVIRARNSRLKASRSSARPKMSPRLSNEPARASFIPSLTVVRNLARRCVIVGGWGDSDLVQNIGRDPSLLGDDEVDVAGWRIAADARARCSLGALYTD
jgi:hypothetical protein